MEPIVSRAQTTKARQPPPMNGPAAATAAKLRFQLVTKHVILYCGSQRGTLDQVSLALFPLCFVVFAIVYWISYITESKRKSLTADI